MNINRHIKFDGVTNFREVGGLPTEHGRIMKTGLLFRSDELSKLSDDDLVRFDFLDIKTICDLRTENERKAHLDRLPVKCNIKVINIPLSDQNREVNHLQFFFHLAFSKNKIDFEKFIKDHYHKNAFERTAQINKVLTLLSNPKNYPALVHCTVGKDRTGLISALIQLLCGVSRKNVLRDYLLTNQYTEKRIKHLTTFIRRMSLYRISREQLQPLLEARIEYLDDILNLILAKYGNIENYLIKGCGLTDDVLKNIRLIFID